MKVLTHFPKMKNTDDKKKAHSKNFSKTLFFPNHESIKIKKSTNEFLV